MLDDEHEKDELDEPEELDLIADENTYLEDDELDTDSNNDDGMVLSFVGARELNE